ncbi:zinc metallopeptidase [Litorilinea aerophila]|uniref:Zinc metallopeptidase n=1 Tax=Litorilinea aerophila TaxID=1204385 RepID=A0A540VML9_9CHLR|nr:zinc metallopeptidase [Litorilinea aerophila]MCC9074703.1 zinc metallopeptidase [Litorilinea aerophila]OUC06771.1 zinc metallopeptidase [Litorilinea aerophila]GIV75879.1 MAG: zinc metallopeptidase [Litorilinea sp.]
MFFFDPLYLLFALPALILGLYAQMKVQSAFGRYSRVRVSTGITGARAARRILDANGLTHVTVERVGGFLSDHYDPRTRTLRLSPDVYDGPTLAAVGVAAHEAGHALQHQQNYAPLQLRTAMVPSVQIGSWLGPILFVIGLIMSGAVGQSIAWFGLLLFGATALFALVTLPVEFDASRRAKQLLVSQGILTPQELQGVNSVLDAAALTYVAAALQAIMTLLYYASLLMGRRE